jgi:glycosyltransferase involved in cell wall biosynthesis
MRILMLAQFFPPDVGGEERHVLNLSEELARRGHDVGVATQLVPGTAPTETLASGVRIHRFESSAMRFQRAYSDPVRPHHLPFPDPRMTRQLSRLIDHERPDVVHAHNWIVNSAVAIRRGRGRRRDFGLVLTLHDYSNVCAMKRMMLDRRPCSGPAPAKCLTCSVKHYGAIIGTVTAATTPVMRRWKERALDHIVCVSSAVATRNDVAAAGSPSSVIPNFIPDSLIRSSVQPNSPTGPFGLPHRGYLFFAGDLSRDKGIDTLIEAWTALGADRPPLLMVGRRQAETPTDLPRDVHVAEKWPHDQVMAAFRSCALAVLPSAWPDPCPTTVLEAMASGRPVITTSTGGMVDMVQDGVSGVLVPPGDSTELTGAMRRLLADVPLQDRLGNAGRERVRQFTASVVAGRLEDVYRKVVTAA